MNNYTIKQINELLEDKYYFFKDRFENYFLAMGKNEKQVAELWEIWKKFPRVDKSYYETADWIIEMLLKYQKSDIRLASTKHENESKDKKKVFYRKNGEIMTFTADFFSASDVIMYADFLKSNPEVITVVDFIETIQTAENSLTVFDGDIFVTGEDWYANRKNNVIVCYHGCYKKLLYTAGKGYIRNGKPDFDDGGYNYHILTLSGIFHKVGNIFADSSFLLDVEQKISEGNEKT